MSVFTSAQAFQQTRHARRLYIGSFPPNHTNEDELKSFLNHVISKGLGQSDGASFVLSIYFNAKKCFAFTELQSIELATACLALDGIMLKKVPLKVLRANEYRPDLVPPALVGMPIVLDLSDFSFGTANNSINSVFQSRPADLSDSPRKSRPLSMSMKDLSSLTGPASHHSATSLHTIDSIISFSHLHELSSPCISIVGFPYDNIYNQSPTSPSKPPSTSMKGCASTPRVLRQQLRKSRFGSIVNPEYDIDLSSLRILDVGDLLPGRDLAGTLDNIQTILLEVLRAESPTFLIGGSNDLISAVCENLRSCLEDSEEMGVVVVSAHMRDRRQISEANHSSASIFSVRYALQGSLCGKEEVQGVTELGGKVVWLTKDIRGSVSFDSDAKIHSTSRVATTFKDSLSFARGVGEGEGRGVVVAMDMSAASGSVMGSNVSSAGPQGLTADELLDIAFLSGADSNVIAFVLTEFHPDQEDSRGNLFLTELLYRFSLGVAIRSHSYTPFLSKLLPTNRNDLVSFALYVNNGTNAASYQEQASADRSSMRLSHSNRPPSLHHMTGMEIGEPSSTPRTSARISLTTNESSRPNSIESSLGLSIAGQNALKHYSMSLSRSSQPSDNSYLGIQIPYHQAKSNSYHTLEDLPGANSIPFSGGRERPQISSFYSTLSSQGGSLHDLKNEHPSQHKVLIRTHSNMSAATNSSDPHPFDESQDLHFPSPPATYYSSRNHSNSNSYYGSFHQQSAGQYAGPCPAQNPLLTNADGLVIETIPHESMRGLPPIGHNSPSLWNNI